MRLYLVQHGQAKPEDEDPARPLTDGGIDTVRGVARLTIDAFGVPVGRVLHSGKTRARQTAELWAELLGVDVEQSEGLAPNDDPAMWFSRVQAQTSDLMLVGHLPHLGRLAGLLLTGGPERSVVEFRQGGLVALERSDAGWSVALVLPPPRT